MKLKLGVADVPYGTKGGISTGDVASILEDEYSVMGNFAALHMPGIAQAVEISVAEAIDALLMGAPSTLDPFGAASQDVERMFSVYLDDEEIAQTGQTGVPTQAAMLGIRTSLKKKKELKGKSRNRIRGTRRPSFIDTGLYRNSFKAWVE